MKLLVTGGAGFIGSNFIHHILKTYPQYKIVTLDKLTYAGNLDNLSDIEPANNYQFVKGDICDLKLVEEIVSGGIDAILNFAAETHVDRSLYDPKCFVQTNITGTQVLLEAVLKYKVKRFIQISTDEVYGSIEQGKFFTEESLLLPNSPYSASKAGADLLVRSYFKTFKLPVLITRSSNNYGPYQFPEKLIPLFITNALEDRELPLYGDGLYIRDWIYVEDNCKGIDLVLHKGKEGEIYNLGGGAEKTNLEITNFILNYLGKPESLIKHVKDRPAHDRRYAMDCIKAEKELNFRPKVKLEEGLKKTVEWYLNNKEWWKKVKSGEYLKYYENHYLKREKV
ncbi:MAG: dTDP-glucose 4,6-dehydratase [candidate division Zixibacteria bacterium]|nr:dTDP-glucose 4,6-dehydratase [candidate division Zixibacteria bacterium]